MSQPLTPIATIPRPADVAAALEIVQATEPEILPVAEAACDVDLDSEDAAE